MSNTKEQKEKGMRPWKMKKRHECFIDEGRMRQMKGSSFRGVLIVIRPSLWCILCQMAEVLLLAVPLTGHAPLLEWRATIMALSVVQVRLTLHT